MQQKKKKEISKILWPLQFSLIENTHLGVNNKKQRLKEIII